jgi:hypothetical protein
LFFGFDEGTSGAGDPGGDVPNILKVIEQSLKIEKILLTMAILIMREGGGARCT